MSSSAIMSLKYTVYNLNKIILQNRFIDGLQYFIGNKRIYVR